MKKLIDFIHNTKYAIKLVGELLKNFSNIKIAEYYENTFKIKIYKQRVKNYRIRFWIG